MHQSWGYRFKRTAVRIAFSDRYSGLVMISCALLGLIVANIPDLGSALLRLEQIHLSIPFLYLDLSVRDWIQDGLLTIFFLVVGLELKVELRTGDLADIKTASVPVLAAVGGMAMPPLVYVSVIALAHTTHGFGSMNPALMNGWPVPTATDIAFSLAVLSLFSKGLPSEIRAFLMTLATVDDLLGILLIAFLFTSFNEWYWFLGIAIGAVLWFYVVHLREVPWILAAIVGFFLWAMTLKAGVHPTLAGVLVGLLTPTWNMYGEPTSRAQRWHDKLTPWSALVALPVFAFFATAVNVHGFTPAVLISPLFLGLVLALVIGKPAGVMLFSWLSVHVLHLRLPGKLKVRDLSGMSFACGIGFTVSFLIASLAFRGTELAEEARLAVLLESVFSAIVAGIAMRIQSRRPRYLNWEQPELDLDIE